MDLCELKDKVEQLKTLLDDIESDLSDMEDKEEQDQEEDEQEVAPEMDAKATLEAIVLEEDTDSLFEELSPETWVLLARASGVVEMLQPLIERTVVVKIIESLGKDSSTFAGNSVSELRSALDSWKEEEIQDARDFFEDSSYKHNLLDPDYFNSDGKQGLKLSLRLLISLFRERYPRIFIKNAEKSKEVLEVFFEAFESVVDAVLEDFPLLLELAGYKVEDSKIFFAAKCGCAEQRDQK